MKINGDSEIVKKLKLGLMILFFIFLTVVVLQNREFLLETESAMYVNVGFYDFEVPETPMYLYFIAFFVCGFILASFFAMVKHVRVKKDYEDKIAELKMQIEGPPMEEGSHEINKTEDEPIITVDPKQTTMR